MKPKTPARPTLTPAGSVRFEEARRRLAAILDREVEAVRDVEVQVFLEKGEAAAKIRATE